MTTHCTISCVVTRMKIDASDAASGDVSADAVDAASRLRTQRPLSGDAGRTVPSRITDA